MQLIYTFKAVIYHEMYFHLARAVAEPMEIVYHLFLTWGFNFLLLVPF